MSGQWGTINEAAEHWRVSRRTVHRWIQNKLVLSKKSPSDTPRVLLVDRRDIDIQRVLAPAKRSKG